MELPQKPNVPIPGLLFSMEMEQTGARRRVKPILDLVDKGRIAFSPAVELSYLTHTEQAELWDIMQSQDCTPSLSQAVRLKKLSQKVELTPEAIFDIMSEEKANQKERVRIEVSCIRKYFPKGYTSHQMEEKILQMLEDNCKKPQTKNGARIPKEEPK